MTENDETSDAPITNTPELKLQHRINLDYQKSRLTEYFLIFSLFFPKYYYK